MLGIRRLGRLDSTRRLFYRWSYFGVLSVGVEVGFNLGFFSLDHHRMLYVVRRGWRWRVMGGEWRVTGTA